MKTRSKSALRTVLALALAILPAAAAAQILSKSEEAQLAVGQCYSACIARAGQGVLEPFMPPGFIAEPLGEGGIFEKLVGEAVSGSNPDDDGDGAHSGSSDSDDGDADDDDWGDVIAISNTGWCEEVQDQVRLMDGCNAGCLDVEAAYGATASEARKRFKHIFEEARAPLEAAGLWTGYDSSPVPGSGAFEAACEAFLEAAD